MTPRDIIRAVCTEFDVPRDRLMQNRRRFNVPRFVAMYAHRELLNYSYAEIGTVFKRDHSTVIAAIKRLHDVVASDDIVRMRVTRFIGTLAATTQEHADRRCGYDFESILPHQEYCNDACQAKAEQWWKEAGEVEAS